MNLDLREPHESLSYSPHLNMAIELLKIGLPASIMFLFSMMMEAQNVAFVGHLGDPAKVAGVGMANMYINMVA